MKIKNAWKNALRLPTALCSFASSVLLPNNVSLLSDQENFLNLATPNSELEKISNINFSYQNDENNIVYVNNDNQNEVAKEIAFTMFQTESFFYEDAIYTVNDEIRSYYPNCAQQKLIYHKFDEEEMKLSFFYLFAEKNELLLYRAIKVKEVSVLEYLKWNNIGNNQYTMSFTIPFSWMKSLHTFSIEMFEYVPALTESSFIEDEIDYPLSITIGFSNIIFKFIPNNITNFYYEDIDPMDLTDYALKSLLKLDNLLIPNSISYTLENTNNIYKIHVKKISYEINGFQSFSLYYEGNYTILFSQGNYGFNWDVIKTSHNLVTLSTQDLWNELVINQSYKAMIENIELQKDFINNKIRIVVSFDQSKYQNLILYNFMNELFKTKTFDVDMEIDSTISFQLIPDFNHLLFKNFNIDYLIANFNSLPYTLTIIGFENINLNSIDQIVSFTALLSTTIANQNYEFSIDYVFKDFEYYQFLDTQKIEKFFNDNFYNDDNLLDINKVYLAFESQTNWNYLLSKSNNLIFKNLEIKVLEDLKQFQLTFDVYNTSNLYLDSASLNVNLKQLLTSDLDQEETNEKETTQSFNFNYLWILAGIIPVIVISFFIYKSHKKRNRI